MSELKVGSYVKSLADSLSSIAVRVDAANVAAVSWVGVAGESVGDDANIGAEENISGHL